MRPEEFDQKFDDDDDVTGDLGLGAVRRPALGQRRVAEHLEQGNSAA